MPGPLLVVDDEPQILRYFQTENFLLATVGIVLGMLMARVRWIEIVLEPIFSFTYPVPKIALYPIFIFVFGLGSLSKVALIFLETVDEEQYTGKPRSDDGARAAAFSSPWQGNPLLKQVAAEVGVDQSALHFRYGTQ